MPEVSAAEARRLIEDARAEQARFEAFILGYVQGMQDSEAGKTFSGPEDFEARVSELFGQEADDE